MVSKAALLSPVVDALRSADFYFDIERRLSSSMRSGRDGLRSCKQMCRVSLCGDFNRFPSGMVLNPGFLR